jgi:hypothetical protein
MKKIYLLPIFISFISLSCCCSGDDVVNVQNDEKHFKITSINPNDNSVYNTKDYYFDDTGKVVKELFQINNVVLKYEYEYNQNGNLIRKFEGGVLKQEFFWNINNDIATYTLPNGNIVKYYFQGKKIVKIESLSSNGTLYYTTTYEYDLNGNLTSEYVNNEHRKEYSGHNTIISNPLHRLESIIISMNDPTCYSTNIFNKLIELPYTEYNEGDNEWVFHQQTIIDYNWFYNINNAVIGLKYIFSPRYIYEYN